MEKKIQIVEKLYELYSTLPVWEKHALARAFVIDKNIIYVKNIVPTQGKNGYLFTYHNSYLGAINLKGIEILQKLSDMVGIREMVIVDYISAKNNEKMNLKYTQNGK